MGSTERVEVGGSSALASAHESVQAALKEARESQAIQTGQPAREAPPAEPPAAEEPPQQ